MLSSIRYMSLLTRRSFLPNKFPVLMLATPVKRQMSIFYYEKGGEILDEDDYDNEEDDMREVNRCKEDMQFEDEEFEDFLDDCEEFGAAENPNLRHERFKPKEERAERRAIERSKRAQQNVWSLVHIIQLKRSRGFNMAGK